MRREGSHLELASPIHVYGPYRVFEDDDMDSEVASIVPAPGWQIEIGCTLSREETWEDALDLAKYIAVECRGVIPDGGVRGRVADPRAQGAPRVLEEDAGGGEAEARRHDSLEWFSHTSRSQQGPVRPSSTS